MAKATAKADLGRRVDRAAFERASGAATLQANTGTVDRADRIVAGRALRKDVPRSSHGDWKPAADRPDPVAVLEAQGESRVPELLPIRHGRMAESQFGFFRGAAAGMAADLASTPSTGITVQLCGDGHLVNFGGFATPERRLIFDVNDFDETLPGPWEWDLKRLGASFAVAARSKGLPDEVGETAVLRLDLGLRGPAVRLRDDSYARRLVLEHRYRLGRGDGSSRRRRRHPGRSSTTPLRGRTRTTICRPCTSSPRSSTAVDGSSTSFRWSVMSPTTMTLDRMQALLDGYRASLPDDVCHLLDRFTLTDAARKVVGVGSVGTRCSIALLEGGGADDPLILQIKEAQASVLERAPRALRVRQPRPPRRRGPAAHASRQRPVPRLDPRRDLGRRLLLAQPARHEGVGRRQFPSRRPRSSTTRSCAAGPWRAPTRVPATPRPSPATSARETSSARRWAASPRRMPIRTHSTTPRSCRRSRTAG